MCEYKEEDVYLKRMQESSTLFFLLIVLNLQKNYSEPSLYLISLATISYLIKSSRTIKHGHQQRNVSFYYSHPCCLYFVWSISRLIFTFLQRLYINFSETFQLRNTIISNEKLIKSSTLQHFLLKYFGNINVLLLWQVFGKMLYCESLLVKL